MTDCTRAVSLVELSQGDAGVSDLRDARQACGCVVCLHGLDEEGVVGRQTIEDLKP